MSEQTPPVRSPGGPAFWVGLVVGWGVIAFGVVGVLNSVWLRDRPLDVLWWVLGSLVLHDALLAPLVTVVVLLVARFLPTTVRGPVAGALVLTALVVLFAYPLLRAFGRREANPSILPGDYPRHVLLLVALIWAVAGIVIAVRVRRASSS
jgi:hypothetical protein